MIFDSDYWNSLNRKQKEEVTLNPKQLGYSLGGDPLQNLKSGIFTGTGNMELTFFNAPGKGQKKDTPESWGKTERQEMKELARVNEVNVTVHATPNMGGGGASFSGFTGQAFSDEARQKAVDEMRRTADFASDISDGGPVVFHIDGFQRPVYEAGTKEGAKPDVFARPVYDEKKKHPLFFVDEKSGKIASISPEDKIHRPKKYESGQKKGQIIINPETGIPEMEELSFEQTKQEYLKEIKKDPKILEEHPSELSYFYKELKEGQVEELRARSHEYIERANAHKKIKEEYEKKLNEYNENVKNGDKTYQNKFFTEMLQMDEIKGGRISPDELKKIYENPRDFLKERINESNSNATIYETGAVGLARNLETAKEEVESFKPIVDYTVEREADTIAHSAMEALAIEKKKKLKNPLWVAPENWMVESYGSHPKEYRNIIEKSREAMTDMLVKKDKISQSKAKKIAEEHIRGTFDIGHLNMWKKYYKGDDKQFAKWMESNLRPLIRDKIIGHVHLSDNFGFHDEHIELGEGNAPLQEFFRAMKEEGFEGTAVAEPGGQREGQMHRVWTSALELGGSPVYRIDAASKTWTDVEGSYFGRTQSPTFLVGDYAPSKDWTLWSEVPFE